MTMKYEYQHLDWRETPTGCHAKSGSMNSGRRFVMSAHMLRRDTGKRRGQA